GRHPGTTERTVSRGSVKENNMRDIRWGRIIGGGFLVELALFAIAIPVFALGAQGSLNYIVPPAAFIASIFGGVWVARKPPGRPVLHGTLAGVVATLIYLGLSFGQPESAAYIAAHGLKILGGAAGGFVSSKRLKTAMSG